MSETAGDAAVWRNGVLSYLERAPGGATADARAISLDGHVVVGSARLLNLNNQPARWVDGHIEPLGDIPGSNSNGNALAVNGDGSVIVGEAGGSDTAFRWINGAMEALPLINGSDIEQSTAFDVSADGRRIVGQETHFNFLTDAILWEDGVPRNLGYLPGFNKSFPYAISADGELFFGESGSSFSNFRAFVWDDANGIQDLMQILSNAGVDLHGWTRLSHIEDVSGDGHTILGYGYNAQGGFTPPSSRRSRSPARSASRPQRLFYLAFDADGGGSRTGHSQPRAVVPHASEPPVSIEPLNQHRPPRNLADIQPTPA